MIHKLHTFLRKISGKIKEGKGFALIPGKKRKVYNYGLDAIQKVRSLSNSRYAKKLQDDGVLVTIEKSVERLDYIFEGKRKIDIQIVGDCDHALSFYIGYSKSIGVDVRFNKKFMYVNSLFKIAEHEREKFGFTYAGPSYKNIIQPLFELYSKLKVD